MKTKTRSYYVEIEVNAMNLPLILVTPDLNGDDGYAVAYAARAALRELGVQCELVEATTKVKTEVVI